MQCHTKASRQTDWLTDGQTDGQAPADRSTSLRFVPEDKSVILVLIRSFAWLERPNELQVHVKIFAQ